MPIYEYKCVKCGSKFEHRHNSIGERDNAPPCPECGAEGGKRLFSGFSVSHLPSFGGGKTCCGVKDPGDAGCAGPGSCCGKGK